MTCESKKRNVTAKYADAWIDGSSSYKKVFCFLVEFSGSQ